MVVGGETLHLNADQWERWCQEDQQQIAALFQRFGSDTVLGGVAWPEGAQPQIDQVEGEELVQLPEIAKPVETFRQVRLPFDPAAALQTVEAVLTAVDRDRGSNLWPDFQKLAGGAAAPVAAEPHQLWWPSPSMW